MEQAKKTINLANVANVQDAVQLNIVLDCAKLRAWQAAEGTIQPAYATVLAYARKKLRENYRTWNEEELKMHFISPILSVANTNIPNVCKTFFERPLHGIINNYEMDVITDCMVALPKLSGDPDKPYFFLQEFKQSQRFGRTDPEGQMLAAMLLAQQSNADDKYLYGCFVIEKNWHFTTLKGLDYCVSPQFDATKKEDLIKIVYMLCQLKELILNR